MKDSIRMQVRWSLYIVALSFGLCVGLVWTESSAGMPQKPSPGRHPYFSKHPKQWSVFVRLIRATRQLRALTPRSFAYSLPAWTPTQQPHAMEMYRGEFVLLTRWATWCTSCKYDLRAKRRLLRRFTKIPFAILGVTHESFKRVQMYQKTAPLRKRFRTTLVDPTGRWARYFRGMMYPTTALIDPWGWMIAERVGPGLWDTPAYRRLFKFLEHLAPLAWKALPARAPVCRPQKRGRKQ